MFTGLVEATGNVVALERNGEVCKLRIRSELADRDDLQLGESIAVNGVCLTLTDWDRSVFCADVSSETLRVSTLGHLKSGSRVNLERALRLSDRLGGHLVSGHVDAVGALMVRASEGAAQRLEFSLPPEIARYVVAKGSIAIDGISLTVNSVDEGRFSVMVIPHTLALTTLKNLAVGGRVNLESDILARYVERLLGTDEGRGPERQGISLEFLAKNGFM